MPETETNEKSTNQEQNKRTEQPGAAEEKPKDQPAQPEKKKKPVLLYAVGGVLLVLAIIFGTRFYLFNRVHVSTDDAYVTGDLVNVSPQINGTLESLLVKEGDYVKSGQLIATIDPSGPQANLRQSEANYQAAQSQIPVAQKNLEYQKLATDAAVKKAQSALSAQQSKTNGARQQVTLTSDTVSNQISQAKASVLAADAQWDQAKAQVTSAVASKDNYVQAVQTSRDALANYQQQILTAQHAQQSAASRAAAAAALADKANKDAARYSILYSEDAISAQTLDQSKATAQNTASQLQAAQSDAQQAESQVESAKRAATQALSQVEQAKKNVAQAAAMVAAAQKAADASLQQVKVAQAGLGVAEANSHQVGIQESNLESTSQQTGEAEADIANAQSGQAQVAAREENVKTAQAQAAQAKAALTNAQITVGDTKIFAPTDGEVVRKDSNVGATMAPGSTVVTITKGDYVWVTANFKETQLADVRVGQPAEIEVDAFGGKTFKGRVRNILEATGAATALLPPDNATGNFTKVVQRIPVRIELVPAGQGDDKSFATADDIRNLRQGMSVTATISTSDQTTGQPITSESGSSERGSDKSVSPGMGQDNSGTPSTPGADNGTTGSQMGTDQGTGTNTPQGGQPNSPSSPSGGPGSGMNPGSVTPNPGSGQPPVSPNGQGMSSAGNPGTGNATPGNMSSPSSNMPNNPANSGPGTNGAPPSRAPNSGTGTGGTPSGGTTNVPGSGTPGIAGGTANGGAASGGAAGASGGAAGGGH